MDWDFSSFRDIGWLIPTLISFGILIVMVIAIRVKHPKIVINIWKRSKNPGSGIIWGIGGVIVGLIIGKKIDDWVNEEE